MLAEDPSAFGLIYVLKFSHDSSYFIWKVSKNTSYSWDNATTMCQTECMLHPEKLWFLSWYFDILERCSLVACALLKHEMKEFKYKNPQRGIILSIHCWLLKWVKNKNKNNYVWRVWYCWLPPCGAFPGINIYILRGVKSTPSPAQLHSEIKRQIDSK